MLTEHSDITSWRYWGRVLGKFQQMPGSFSILASHEFTLPHTFWGPSYIHYPFGWDILLCPATWRSLCHTRSITVLARMAWLIGFCTTNGFFQMEFEDLMGLYMDSVHSHLLRFKGNHHTISPNGTGNTTVNLQFIRKCFHGLCTFVPSKCQDPKDLPMWIGLFVVLIMESKSREIHRRHCHAILEVITPELGRDYVNSFIKN